MGDIGEEQEPWVVEPVEDPLPVEVPAPPEREPVPA